MKDGIVINDSYRKNLKEEVSASAGLPRMRGAVEVFEKNKDGILTKIREKHNLIVYGGREWLLRRAFGVSIDGNDSNIYNKVIRWFAVGNGGGEPGNPLQAGATYGSDTALLQQVRLRSDLTVGDVGYTMYGSDSDQDHGYYKHFASVVMKEDHANPYDDSGVVRYPPLIAEIRIELSSDDANGGAYEDLNEAALFVADPTDTSGPGGAEDPGYAASSGGTAIGDTSVIQVIKENDYAIYVLNTTDLQNVAEMPGVAVGDYMYVTRVTGTANTIAQASQALIVDLYDGATGRSAYIVVEKPDAVDEDPIVAGQMTAYAVSKLVTPYSMFSRVTFSSIRKTVDREIVFLWKIYF